MRSMTRSLSCCLLLLLRLLLLSLLLLLHLAPVHLSLPLQPPLLL